MNIVKKISDKGFNGCLNSLKFQCIKHMTYLTMKYYKLYPIESNSIVLESEGDCSDNAFALFDYMKNNNYLNTYKVTWLVDNPNNYHKTINVSYLNKDIYNKFSPKTIKAIRTCHWYIYDHCDILMKNKRVGQKIIFLNHGAGFKSPRNTPISYADETYITSKMFYYPTAACWGCSISTILDIGFPRLDYFFKNNNKNQLNLIDDFHFEEYNSVFLWMPTFRISNNEKLSENYFRSRTGLPIFYLEDELNEFNEMLKQINSLCVFKIHHLQANLNVFQKKYTNIILLNDELIGKYNLQLYEFIKLTTCLITDYSSISTDYMLLDRPIIYTMDDYNEYRNSRGFSIEDPSQYFIGYHVYNKKQLFAALESISKGIDIYKEEREKILPILHTHVDGNACFRILEHLGIKNS